MIKVYEAMTWEPSSDGARMRPVQWFCENRPHPLVDYAQAIVGYERLPYEERFYPSDCIDGYLTADEVAELRGFVAKRYGWQVLACAVELPIAANSIGLGALPAGGGADFLMLAKTPGYNLSISIWGHFDLRRAAPFDRERSAGTFAQRSLAINSPLVILD